jgi:4-alpha-glucanotransferase
MKRSSGILLHPTSLPGPYGIGTLGQSCVEFIDFLANAGQKLWQILPLGPTGYGDSPYQCFSACAGNQFLIDAKLLIEKGWLMPDELPEDDHFPITRVDYAHVSAFNAAFLKSAWTGFRHRASHNDKDAFYRFCDENNHWLNDYALFISIKEENGLRPWWEWDQALVKKQHELLDYYRYKLKENIEYQKFVQFLFFDQWYRVKHYANSKGIQIIGDIPIYVSPDSVEAWMNTDIFQYNTDSRPVNVAGVPPDYFSETGQLWGNPVYDWNRLRETAYHWWVERLRMNLKLFDIIRIDHFRGFAAYWAVPYGETTAMNGEWLPAYGKELFDTLNYHLGTLPVIAEDLGVITPDVEALRDGFNLPGMKILQFAFDSSEGNNYLPHAYPHNCIVYTGTHDNDTVLGWFDGASTSDKEFCLRYLNSSGQNIHWDFMRAAWASVADVAIAPIQDILGLGTDARMNLPGTTANNWQWRVKAELLTPELAEKLASLTKLYGR